MQEYAVKDAVNIGRTGRVIVGLTTASWRRRTGIALPLNSDRRTPSLA